MLNPKKLNDRKYKRGTVTEEEHRVLLATLEHVVEEFERPVFIEFGTHKGGTSRAMIQALNDLKAEALYYGIDIDKLQQPSRKAKLNGEKPFTAKQMWEKNVIPHLAGGTVEAQFLLEVSWIAGRQWQRMMDSKVHWVFVDGCHCYECCKQDIEEWGRNIELNGLMLIHDCHPQYIRYRKTQAYHGSAQPFGVWQARCHAKYLHEHFTFLCQTNFERPGPNKLFGGMQVWRKIKM